MGILRWTWPMMATALLILTPWGSYGRRPVRPVNAVIVDKTVPFSDRVEHRSLFWLFDHMKLVHPDGKPYDPDADYLGAFPGPVPGDPPVRMIDLTPEAALDADLLYLVDTYGVYRDDLKSGAAMKAALERSPKIYGGTTLAEAQAVREALQEGRTVVGEFNTMASPTGPEARKVLESVFAVRWTHWIGRYFDRLENRGEVPRWMRLNYEREHLRPWTFEGPGYVLLQDDAHCEVLRVGVETERIGLTLERERPLDPLLGNAVDGTAYPYWFEWTVAQPGARVLASFQWHLRPEGRERLRAHGFPERFPAVIRKQVPQAGMALYFAGDFADSPTRGWRMPFAGYPTARKWLEGARLVPTETAFYWSFYVPVMTRLLDDVAASGR